MWDRQTAMLPGLRTAVASWGKWNQSRAPEDGQALSKDRGRSMEGGWSGTRRGLPLSCCGILTA